MPKPKNKGKRGKNRKRGKNEAGDGKIKEDGLEIKSPPQMSPKSPSLTPEKQSVLGKICVICLGSPDVDLPIGGVDDDEPWDMNFSLFLLDLDAECKSSSDVPVNPNMCFSSFRLSVQGFCVLGQTLYLFGNEKRDVFSYALSSIPSVPSSPPVELTPDMLSSAPPDMNFRKYHPRGCQTPDGTKMVVFSSTFYVRGQSSGNFELFDGEKWTELPDLHPVISGSVYASFLHAISYSFVDDEPLLLINTEVGNFALNVEQPERGWSRWKDFELPRIGYGLPMLVRGRWRLMSWFQWVDGNEPELSYPWGIDGYHMCGGKITWLSPLNRFCVLRSHVETTTMQPHLTIDVCDFDDEVSGPKLKKRVKFVVGLRMQRLFLPWLLHSMRKEAV